MMRAQKPLSRGADPALLARLRGVIAGLEARETALETPLNGAHVVTTGEDRLDTAFHAGGLSRGVLHEAYGTPEDGANRAPHDVAGALSGFALALAARFCGENARRRILWISDRQTRQETGRLYGPGLKALGVDPARLLFVEAKDATAVLWAMEEGLACGALALIAGEIWGAPAACGPSQAMTASRRLHLAAQRAGTTALLLRHGAEPLPSAATTRWRIAPVPGVASPERFTLSRPAWTVTLDRNRAGATGHWRVEWNAHDKAFVLPDTAPFSDRLSAASAGRATPPRAEDQSRKAG